MILFSEHEFSFIEGNAKGGTSRVQKMKSEQGIKFHVLLTSYELINVGSSHSQLN